MFYTYSKFNYTVKEGVSMKKDYIALNNFILAEENLTLEEGYMLQVLFQYHNIEEGYAYPTYAKLMKACKTNRQAKISKILKSLVAKGYITVEKHGNNRYYIAGVEKFIEGNAPVQEEKASTVEGLSASQEKTLMKLAGTKERFLQMVNYARSRAKNLFAYVYRLLKDNVVLGAKDTSVNPHYNSATPKGYSDFNNFKAREYDYEALERKLLGWD